MWEYKTETLMCTFDSNKSIGEKSDKLLEKYAKEGWELVNFQILGTLSSMMIFIFKRERME